MIKKVLSLALVIALLSVSTFAFTGSSVDIQHNGEVVLAEGAGIEVRLTKDGSTLTATAYVTGMMKNVSAVQVGLKIVDTAKLTYLSHGLADEFSAVLPANWGPTTKLNTAKTIAGYYCAKNTAVDYLNLSAGQTVKYAEFKYTIADGVEVNSSNYSDFIEFNNQFSGYTRLAFNDAALYIGRADYPEVFTFDASGLDSYNLSINTPANGITELSATTVAGGQSADLTVIPAVGYYISSVMAGETNITSSFDAYRGGTIKYTPTANTAITVTFAEIENVTEDVTTSTGMTGVDALTLPEVFRGKVNNEAVEDVSIAFGQIAPNGGKVVAGYGIYLTYTNGNDVTTMKPGVGPKFAAKTISGDNQFGIIFEQIKPGSYNAQTYIEYTDGSIVLGIKVPFTVAE